MEDAVCVGGAAHDSAVGRKRTISEATQPSPQPSQYLSEDDVPFGEIMVRRHEGDADGEPWGTPQALKRLHRDGLRGGGVQVVAAFTVPNQYISSEYEGCGEARRAELDSLRKFEVFEETPREYALWRQGSRRALGARY